MTVSFHPYIFDASREMHIIPSAARDNEDFLVCVSNANACDVLLALGLRCEPNGILAFEAFSGLVTASLRRHLGGRSPALPAAQYSSPSEMTTIFLGRAEGYIERRLYDLAKLLQRSRTLNPTHFGWG